MAQGKMVYVQFIALVYLFNGILTPFGLFNARILFLCKV